MKKERNCKNKDLGLYQRLEEYGQVEDTRYWGVFKYGKSLGHSYGEIKVDPKRFQKTTRSYFTAEQLKVINARRTHYFYPAKHSYADYNCNVFINEIDEIKAYWDGTYKDLIQREQQRIIKPKKLVAADDDNFMCGITDYDESLLWATMANLRNDMKYKREVSNIVISLYAQFFHQMASRIEAITVYVLSRNGKNVEHFDRNALYDYAGAQGTARDFENYESHDKLYCIWHFLKHNSVSTYEKLKSKYPEVLVDEEFKQGYLAYSYIKFSEDLVLNLLNGCGEFFKEYCLCVYNENFNEAQWNYADYFTNIMSEEIENITNPLGL